MKVDLMIVTFRRDLEYTRFCLMGIKKYVRGFNSVVMVVPNCDYPQFSKLLTEIGLEMPYQLHGFDEEPGKGMLHHMAIVCNAERYCAADYVAHIDADCIFHEPVTPDDYFVNGKPVLLIEEFSRLDGNVLCWQKAVQKALGWKPDYETMRRHPAVHPRWVYPKVREAICKNTNHAFLEYVLMQRNEYPQTFAEFPTIGAWCLRYAKDSYHWIDLGKELAPKPKLSQFWTHGGVDMAWTDGQGTVREKVEKILS